MLPQRFPAGTRNKNSLLSTAPRAVFNVTRPESVTVQPPHRGSLTRLPRLLHLSPGRSCSLVWVQALFCASSWGALAPQMWSCPLQMPRWPPTSSRATLPWVACEGLRDLALPILASSLLPPTSLGPHTWLCKLQAGFQVHSALPHLCRAALLATNVPSPFLLHDSAP